MTHEGLARDVIDAHLPIECLRGKFDAHFYSAMGDPSDSRSADQIVADFVRPFMKAASEAAYQKGRLDLLAEWGKRGDLAEAMAQRDAATR